MIESVEFKNFKALKDTTLPLSRFTLIIGPNGSGKSTALQAIRATRTGAFKFQDIVNAKTRIDQNSSVEIILNLKGPKGRIRRKSIWTPNHPFDISYHSENSHSMEQLKNSLGNIEIYALNAKTIASSSELLPKAKLESDGSNLAIVLDLLRDEEPERFEALNKELGRLLPEFDRILFSTPATGKRAFLLRMREGHYKIPATDLSEGTLLALALLTLTYLPKPPSLVCLEEPDRGIHPRLLRDVKDALYRLAYPESVGEKREPVQVIATTHSPYLLDLFKDHPEEIVIANKIGQEVKFERLSDRPHYEEIIQDVSLGDAWYTGILGGVPAHP